ncbi:MAG: galactose mutarotase, partial [Clostridia bacterium]|nr:galactose mutarotase [Clostridia bacterium]
MKKVLFGKTSRGEETFAYTIKNGCVEIVILDYGATIQSFKYKGIDIALGYDDALSYEKEDGYLGACVGRVANRIANAKFTLDEKECFLDKNDGNNTLHGGFCGFASKFWKVESHTDSEIVLSVFSPDGEGGFPANLQATVRYFAYANGLGIEYLVTADKKTPVNMTNHTYFNLNQSEDLQKTTLCINADCFTPIGDGLIPTGELRSVKNTPFDFTKPKEILKDIEVNDKQLKIAGGYDHNFVLNGTGFREIATLEGERLKLKCSSDREGVQIYSGNFLNGKKGKGGRVYGFRSGICLETQSFPNFVNQKDFPQSFVDLD